MLADGNVETNEMGGIPPRPDLFGHVTRVCDVFREKLPAYIATKIKPEDHKVFRKFPQAEAARMVGVSERYFRDLVAGNDAVSGEIGERGWRFYTLREINCIRILLDEKTGGSKHYSPRRRKGELPKIVVTNNFKGGSGKSTTTVHAAQYLAIRGHRVLAIDIDPQGSLTSLLGVRPELVKPGQCLYGAIHFNEDRGRLPLSQIARETYIDGLSLVPACLYLAEWEHQVQSRLAARHRDFVLVVKQAIDEAADNYDVIFVDCPPQLNYLTMAFVLMANGIIITVNPAMLDLQSMSQFTAMFTDYVKTFKQHGFTFDADFFKILITKMKVNDRPHSEAAGLLRMFFKDLVLTNAALESTAVNDAGLANGTIYDSDRRKFTRATIDRAIESFDLVNAEIEELIHQSWGRV